MTPVQLMSHPNYSWLLRYTSFWTTHYFMPGLQLHSLFSTSYIRFLLLLHLRTSTQTKSYIKRSSPTRTFVLRLRPRLQTMILDAMQHTFLEPRLNLSNATLWTEKYLLSLLYFPLMGLPYNRTHYSTPSNETLKRIPRLSLTQNQTNQFPTSIRSLSFSSKINLFRTWLTGNREQQLFDYQHLPVLKDARLSSSNNVHQLNPSLSLLFLDIKRPSVKSIQLSCREIITFFSKFTQKKRSAWNEPKKRSATLRPILRSRVQTKSRRSKDPFWKSLRYGRIILSLRSLRSFVAPLFLKRIVTPRKSQPVCIRYRESLPWTNLCHTKVTSSMKPRSINLTTIRPFLRFVKKLHLRNFVNMKANSSWHHRLKFYIPHVTQKFEQRARHTTRLVNAILFSEVKPVIAHLTWPFSLTQIKRPRKATLQVSNIFNSIHLPTQFRSLYGVPSHNFSVLVYPRHTRRFKRSLFFFLLLLQESKLKAIDWLTAVRNYAPFYSFTLFPVANSFKISIFKRLNTQKRLLTSQVYSYNEPSSNNFRTKLAPLLVFPANRPSLRVHESPRANFSFSQWQFLVKYMNYQIGDSSRYLRIRRLKFKPGYSRLWRESRVDIKEILEMKIRYQHRLTLKLHQLYRHQYRGPATYSTATIFFALLGAQISVDMWSTLELFNNEVIYLNGKLCTNQYTHLFLQDLIQVIINLKFYFLMRFLQNQIFLTIARFNKIFYRKYRIRPSHSLVRTHKKLPWTFFHLQNGYVDILPYLEVDYFTLSSFVILDQRALKLHVPIRAYTLELNILNMYNWKYIT